jgi:hypothetical protein
LLWGNLEQTAPLEDTGVEGKNMHQNVSWRQNMARSIMDSPGSLFVFRNKPLWAPIHRRKTLGQLFNHQLLWRTLLLRVNEQSAMEMTEWFLCYKIQSKWQRWNTSWRRMECGGTVPRIYPRQMIQVCDLHSQPQFLPPLRAVNERVPTMVLYNDYRYTAFSIFILSVSLVRYIQPPVPLFGTKVGSFTSCPFFRT